MLARGIPGTVTDESLMAPMHITSNNNYKGTFSTYSSNGTNGDISNFNQ